MKSTKRRTRVLAGFALIAATAAVASATMLGSGAASVSALSARMTSAGGSGVQTQVPVHSAEHPPIKLAGATPRKRSLQVAASGTEPAAVIAVAGVATGGTGGSAACEALGIWWLEYAGTCSRTRGQPRTDALA